MIYSLYVIIIFQKIKSFLKILDGCLICKIHISLRDHSYLCFRHYNPFFFQSFTNLREIIRIGEDFITVIFFRKVFCTGIQSRHHQIIRIHFTVFFSNNDLSFFIEHKRYTSRCTYISVSFSKCTSYIRSGSVLIICQGINDNCDTIRTITFISDHFVVICICISGSTFNTSFNGIIRHIVCFCFCDNIAQFTVIFRIRSAFFYCDYDFSTDNSENFSFFCIIFFFFMFDIGEL